MDGALPITEYLPIAFKTRNDQEYIEFLMDAFETNYTHGKQVGRISDSASAESGAVVDALSLIHPTPFPSPHPCIRADAEELCRIIASIQKSTKAGQHANS